MPSATHQGYALLRSILKSGSEADIVAATAYGRQIKLYPLAEAAKPPETVFCDAIDVVYDATIPYDWRFFQALDRFVQRELWLTRDKAMIDPLKSIGIEKGKPFNPDDQTKLMLNDAAAEAHAVLEMKYDALFSPYFDGSRWALPVSPEYHKAISISFADPNSYPVDDRGVIFSFAFFTPKHLGQGQFYLMTIKDKDGEAFHGGDTYRLIVPPNAPVNQYWSATAYDRATHAPHSRPVAFQPLIAKPGASEECRWIGRDLFRSQGTGRQGDKLGADERQRTVRGALPLLRSRKASVRQGLGPAGYREAEIIAAAMSARVERAGRTSP